MTAPDESRPARDDVPVLLRAAAGWCWRILVIALAITLLGRLALRLEIVVVPLLTALLLTALLEPVAQRLRAVRIPRSVAAVTTVLLAMALLGGIGAYVIDRAIAQYPQLVDQISQLVNKTQVWLAKGPLKLGDGAATNLGDTVIRELRARQGELATGVVAASRTIVDVLTSAVLTFFLTIFLLYDGPRIWAWCTGLVPQKERARTDEVGARMWGTLSGYVRGTFIVASFHGAVMGVTLAIVGVPLVAPLTLLVFIGSFIPLIGAVVFGGLAVLVTLVTNGLTASLVVLVVLIVENQVEGHVLQPFVVGRHVRLHPMAIALTLTAGAVLAGLPGAIFGVPLIAAINAAAVALRSPRVGGPDAVAGPGSVAGPEAVAGIDEVAEPDESDLVPAREPPTSVPQTSV